ncbi:MAG: hypothetical protein ABIG46_01115, partial [Candidatus Omnitrophota bacterium]
MVKRLNKTTSFILIFLLLFQQSGLSQVAGELDLSFHFLKLGSSLTTSSDRFRPLHLRYLGYDALKNNFNILLDKGDELGIGKGTGRGKEEQENLLQDKTKKLMGYFYTGLALPNSSFWVNLRPDSPDNIIDPYLAQTDLGKVLLEADLHLKKDTAQYTSPATPEGKVYWSRLYKKAEELFGTDTITIPTLTRPWIVPGEIIIRESIDNAYIYKATLKVMLEEDYLKSPQSTVHSPQDYSFDDQRSKVLNEYSTELIRELIIPKLTKEVNSSRRYAPLRQVYYSLILAQWFKNKSTVRGPQSAVLNKIDSYDLTNLISKEPYSVNTYFQAYQDSFNKGEYNLKEEHYSAFGQVIRSYTSGGMDLNIASSALTTIPAGNPGIAQRLLNNAGSPLIRAIADGNTIKINQPALSESKEAVPVNLGDQPVKEEYFDPLPLEKKPIDNRVSLLREMDAKSDIGVLPEGKVKKVLMYFKDNFPQTNIVVLGGPVVSLLLDKEPSDVDIAFEINAFEALLMRWNWMWLALIDNPVSRIFGLERMIGPFVLFDLASRAAKIFRQLRSDVSPGELNERIAILNDARVDWAGYALFYKGRLYSPYGYLYNGIVPSYYNLAVTSEGKFLSNNGALVDLKSGVLHASYTGGFGNKKPKNLILVGLISLLGEKHRRGFDLTFDSATEALINKFNKKNLIKAAMRVATERMPPLPIDLTSDQPYTGSVPGLGPVTYNLYYAIKNAKDPLAFIDELGRLGLKELLEQLTDSDFNDYPNIKTRNIASERQVTLTIDDSNRIPGLLMGGLSRMFIEQLLDLESDLQTALSSKKKPPIDRSDIAPLKDTDKSSSSLEDGGRRSFIKFLLGGITVLAVNAIFPQDLLAMLRAAQTSIAVLVQEHAMHLARLFKNNIIKSITGVDNPEYWRINMKMNNKDAEAAAELFMRHLNKVRGGLEQREKPDIVDILLKVARSIADEENKKVDLNSYYIVIDKKEFNVLEHLSYTTSNGEKFQILKVKPRDALLKTPYLGFYHPPSKLIVIIQSDIDLFVDRVIIPALSGIDDILIWEYWDKKYVDQLRPYCAQIIRNAFGDTLKDYSPEEARDKIIKIMTDYVVEHEVQHALKTNKPATGLRIEDKIKEVLRKAGILSFNQENIRLAAPNIAEELESRLVDLSGDYPELILVNMLYALSSDLGEETHIALSIIIEELCQAELYLGRTVEEFSKILNFFADFSKKSSQERKEIFNDTVNKIRKKYGLRDKLAMAPSIRLSSSTQIERLLPEGYSAAASPLTMDVLTPMEKEMSEVNGLDITARRVILAKRNYDVVVGKRNVDGLGQYLRVGKVVIYDQSMRIPNGLFPQDNSWIIIGKDGVIKFDLFLIPIIGQMLNEDLTGQIVWDYGVGDGVLSLLALRLGASRVVGIDSVEEEIVKAKKLLERQGYQGRYFSNEEWKNHQTEEDAQFILINGDLIDWFITEKETRIRVSGGNVNTILADMGPEYGIQNVMIRSVIEDNFPGKIILGGYLDGAGTAMLMGSFGGMNYIRYVENLLKSAKSGRNNIAYSIDPIGYVENSMVYSALVVSTGSSPMKDKETDSLVIKEAQLHRISTDYEKIYRDVSTEMQRQMQLRKDKKIRFDLDGVGDPELKRKMGLAYYNFWKELSSILPGDSALIYPAMGLDVIPASFLPILNINNYIKDRENGQAVFEEILGVGKLDSLGENIRYPLGNNDAFVPESYSYAWINFTGSRFLILKGFAHILKEDYYRKEIKEPFEKYAESLLKKILNNLKSGDGVIILDRESLLLFNTIFGKEKFVFERVFDETGYNPVTFWNENKYFIFPDTVAFYVNEGDGQKSSVSFPVTLERQTAGSSSLARDRAVNLISPRAEAVLTDILTTSDGGRKRKARTVWSDLDGNLLTKVFGVQNAQLRNQLQSSAIDNTIAGSNAFREVISRIMSQPERFLDALNSYIRNVNSLDYQRKELGMVTRRQTRVVMLEDLKTAIAPWIVARKVMRYASYAPDAMGQVEMELDEFDLAYIGQVLRDILPGLNAGYPIDSTNPVLLITVSDSEDWTGSSSPLQEPGGQEGEYIDLSDDVTGKNMLRELINSLSELNRQLTDLISKSIISPKEIKPVAMYARAVIAKIQNENNPNLMPIMRSITKIDTIGIDLPNHLVPFVALPDLLSRGVELSDDKIRERIKRGLNSAEETVLVLKGIMENNRGPIIRKEVDGRDVDVLDLNRLGIMRAGSSGSSPIDQDLNGALEEVNSSRKLSSVEEYLRSSESEKRLLREEFLKTFGGAHPLVHDNELQNIREEALKLILRYPHETIVSLGRTPLLLTTMASFLEEISNNIQVPRQYIEVAFSTRWYRRDPSTKQFKRFGQFLPKEDAREAYRKYLTKIGLSPMAIIGRDNKTVIIDYVETGEGIMSFLDFLLEWAKDKVLWGEDLTPRLKESIIVHILQETNLEKYYDFGGFAVAHQEIAEIDMLKNNVSTQGIYYPVHMWAEVDPLVVLPTRKTALEFFRIIDFIVNTEPRSEIVSMTPQLNADERILSNIRIPITQGSIGSSPVMQDENIGGINSQVSKAGGIDLRYLPIVTEAVSNLKVMLRGRFLENQGLSVSLDAELEELESMVNARIRPSVERIKDCLVSSCLRG